MKLLVVGVLVAGFCFTCAQDNVQDTEDTTENQRGIREYNSDSWRAVEDFPSQGTSGWIPHDNSQETNDQLPKRRRLRKRKRRPPMISLTELSEEEVSNERMVVRRRLRPQRLDQLREPWEEMEDEIVRRPYVRRRIAPTYEAPSDDIIPNEEQVNINPLVATLQFQEEDDSTQKIENEVISNVETKDEINIVYGKPQEQSPTSLPEPKNGEEAQTIATQDLKTLLKQNSGTLSLSEILQQKNLSLSELLTGNQKAISALTEKSEIVVEINKDDPPSDAKYIRRPPSIGLKKRIYEQSDESAEALSSKETLEAQRKRLALLNGFKENRVYSDVTKYEVITEPTTDKRIFVPSHPKYYTSLDYRPDFKHIETGTEPYTEFVTTTATIPPTYTKTTISTTQKIVKELNKLNIKPKVKYSLPITNSKLNKLSTKIIEDEDNYPKPTIPAKAIKINVKDLFGFKTEENQTVKEKTDEPLRMSIDFGVTVKDEITEMPESEEHIITTPQTEKLKYVTAKEEIMEILQDPTTREKLSRILETRNMTIEELVEQRERGSSQLHLADIFHNKTREPEPIEETFVGNMNTNFTIIPLFGRQQKSIADYGTPLYKLEPVMKKINSKSEPQVDIKPKEEYTVTSFPTYKIALNKSTKDSFQWPELYPNLFPKIYENSNKKSELEIQSTSTESYFENGIQRLEEIENKLSSISNNRFNVELDQRTYEDEEEQFFPIPSGVKSAVVASFAIVGASLLVFVTILLIFKWSQKHKQRLNYCSSFSSRIKSPILEHVPKRTIKSFMNETLGRKKNDYYSYNYNKSHIQSMSDDIWENDRKPY